MKKMKKTWVALLVVVCILLGMTPAISMAETTYKVRALQIWGGGTASAANYNTYESEHFQVIYGNTTYNNIVIDTQYLEQVTGYLEQAWDLYINELNMKEPVTSVDSSYDQITPYKVNVVAMGTGITAYDYGWAFASIDAHGYPYLMCGPDALLYETVLSHEFGHVMHYAQGNNSWVDNIYLGPWWEGIANWYMEQYRYEYMPGTTEMSSLYLRANALTQMNGRAYYQGWPFLQYLHENPEGYDHYGNSFIQKLLAYKPSNTNVTFYEVLDACNGDVSVQDTVGNFASHMATLDFEQKETYNAQINKETDVILYWPQRYTVLEPLGEEENTYAVPIERAPQAMGYNIIPLDFTPGTVEVTIEGLTDAEGAGWRGRLVVESEDGVTSYSELFKNGETMSIEVSATDELYLSVAATPTVSSMVKHTIGGWASHSYESNLPYEDKTQYPYSVTMAGAEPKTRPAPSGYYRRHSNGGGWVSYWANVSNTAYVGPNAVVMGNATVSGNAVVDGYATINHSAKVTDNAYVGDYAVLYDRAVVEDNARVIENACLYVDYKVGGNAVIKGQAHGLGSGGAADEAVIYGDWYEDGGRNISSGTYSGYLSINQDSSYSPVTLNSAHVRPYVLNLRSRYEFNGDLKDTVAATHLYSVGNPDFTDEYITFNGDNYVDLNSSVLYYDNVKLTSKVKGVGDVLNIGNGSIVLNIGSVATLKAGEEEICVNAVDADGWNEIEIEFKNSAVTLTVNGASKKSEASITPLTAVREGVSFIGKDFVGSVDYLRIYDNSYEYTGEIGSLTDDYYIVYNMSENDKTATLSSAGKNTQSKWYGWNCANTNVTVGGGLTIKNATTATITAPSVVTDKFVIEFKPSGGKTYPDHGVIDTDGDVLFGYRMATDASTIYTGRGETNVSIRGQGSVTDTASQARLTNFAAEKLYGATSRADRGGVSFSHIETVRITAENSVWDSNLAKQFENAENTTSVLSSLNEGDDVYIVTYSLVDNGLEKPASVNVYKGSFTGFGGFMVAGGTSNVSVTYQDLKIYAENPIEVKVEDGNVEVCGITGDADLIFAVYENDMLTNVVIRSIEAEGVVEIPEGFEESILYVFTKTEELIPLTKAVRIVK